MGGKESMNRSVTIALALGLSAVLTGCATVVRGSKDSVRIESNPSGAQVHLSNGMTGVTPVTFELPRKDSVKVEFQKEGYEPIVRTLTPLRSKNGKLITSGNAIIGGAIGGAIDGSTGAMMDLSPNPLVVRLQPLRPANAAQDWNGIKVGMTRKEARFALGDPDSISDETGDQAWTYKGRGTVTFHNYFVVSWNLSSQSAATEKQPGESPSAASMPAASPNTPETQ